MAAVVISDWKYVAWRRQATPALQLEWLNRHLEEIEKVNLEHSMGNGRSYRMDARVIERLEKERIKLQQSIAIASSLSANASASPTVVRPQI